MWTQDVFLPSSQYPDIKAVNNQSEILPTLRHVANSIGLLVILSYSKKQNLETMLV